MGCLLGGFFNFELSLEERGGEKSLVKIWGKVGLGSFSQVSTKALRREGAGKAKALGPNEGKDG